MNVRKIRPTSIEQREGRGIRQGNENEEVAIYRYVTKGTFDAYNWSLVENKRYLPTHVFISKYDMTGIHKGSLALAEQVMSISTKCIIEKCGRINKWSLDRVLKAVRIQMGMEETI